MKGSHRSSRPAEWPPGRRAQAHQPEDPAHIPQERVGAGTSWLAWGKARQLCGKGGSFKGNPRPERCLSCPIGISWTLA